MVPEELTRRNHRILVSLMSLQKSSSTIIYMRFDASLGHLNGLFYFYPFQNKDEKKWIWI